MFIEVTITIGDSKAKILLNTDQIVEVRPFKDDRCQVKASNGDFFDLYEPYQSIKNLIYEIPPVLKQVFN
jgi:hypothetical protein